MVFQTNQIDTKHYAKIQNIQRWGQNWPWIGTQSNLNFENFFPIWNHKGIQNNQLKQWSTIQNLDWRIEIFLKLFLSTNQGLQPHPFVKYDYSTNSMLNKFQDEGRDGTHSPCNSKTYCTCSIKGCPRLITTPKAKTQFLDLGGFFVIIQKILNVCLWPLLA